MELEFKIFHVRFFNTDRQPTTFKLLKLLFSFSCSIIVDVLFILLFVLVVLFFVCFFYYLLCMFYHFFKPPNFLIFTWKSPVVILLTRLRKMFLKPTDRIKLLQRKISFCNRNIGINSGHISKQKVLCC